MLINIINKIVFFGFHEKKKERTFSQKTTNLKKKPYTLYESTLNHAVAVLTTIYNVYAF